MYDKHVSDCCGCLPTNSVTMATSRGTGPGMERWEMQIVPRIKSSKDDKVQTRPWSAKGTDED